MRSFLLHAAAALLLLLPAVTRAQDPGGPRPSAENPDAVVSRLVTNACASCHSLDRVKTKEANRDEWVSIIARMREKGMALTEKEVPVIAEYLTRAAATLPDAPAHGTGAFAEEVLPFTTENLHVLAPEDLQSTMRNITSSLGLRCSDCHDPNDPSLDDKPLKLKARGMLEMVWEINQWLGAETTAKVTCWTCHRGSITPETLGPGQ